MSAALGERIVSTGPRAQQAPRLSVLTPFYKDNPSDLIARLAPVRRDVEFVLVDDGANSATLAANVLSALERSGASARLIIWGANRGRAAARRGHFLFPRPGRVTTNPVVIPSPAAKVESDSFISQ